MERLRKEQGVPEFSLERLLACSSETEESDEEMSGFLREIRSEREVLEMGRRADQPIRSTDAWIAATALGLDCPLISGLEIRTTSV